MWLRYHGCIRVRDAPEELGERAEEAKPRLFRFRQRGRGQIREQCPYVGHQLRQIGGARAQRCPECIGVPRAGVAAQRLDLGPEGGRAAVRFPAASREYLATPCLSGGRKLLCQPGLADTRLAAHEHDAAPAGTCEVQAPDELPELTLTPDKRHTGPVRKHDALRCHRIYLLSNSCRIISGWDGPKGIHGPRTLP